MGNLNPSWQFFYALQREDDPNSVDRSLARDEALGVILDEIANNVAADQDFLRIRFQSLRRSRISKENKPRALIQRHFRGTRRRGGVEFGNELLMVQGETGFDALSNEQLAEMIGTVLSNEELKLLLEVADGEKYSDLAREHNTTVSSLKSRTFRIRARIRKSRISATLRRELGH
jgi:hypothetical protein